MLCFFFFFFFQCSLEDSAAEPLLTEVAAGSGFLQPHLFDYFVANQNECAFCFGLRVTRVPCEGMVTCQGGVRLPLYSFIPSFIHSTEKSEENMSFCRDSLRVGKQSLTSHPSLFCRWDSRSAPTKGLERVSQVALSFVAFCYCS